MLDMVEFLAGKDNYNLIGIREGEKLHETMIPFEESGNCIEMKEYYIIQPKFTWWNTKELEKTLLKKGKSVSKNFVYSSENKKYLMNSKQLQKILRDYINLDLRQL